MNNENKMATGSQAIGSIVVFSEPSGSLASQYPKHRYNVEELEV